MRRCVYAQVVSATVKRLERVVRQVMTEMDLTNIKALASEVVNMSEYRVQLFDYLKNRMAAIAPNLPILVGELVGARLIAHAGSLVSLAKKSTISRKNHSREQHTRFS